MRRRKFPVGTPAAAAFLCTAAYPEGYYVTRASAGADIIRSGATFRDPWASAKIGPRKPLRSWPPNGALTMIGGVGVRWVLLSEVEAATGPLRWGRSVEPVELDAANAKHNGVDSSCFVAGFRRGKMVAMVGPVASARMPKGGGK